MANAAPNYYSTVSSQLFHGLMSDVKRAYGALIGSILMIILFSFIAKGFFSWDNTLIVAVQAAVLIILAVGQTAVILTGGIDLSSGMVLTISSVITTLIFKGGGEIAGIFGGLAVGLAFGIFTGVLIVFVKIQPFIATLGTMSLAQGLALVLTKGSAISGVPDWFKVVGDGKFLGIPVPVYICFVVTLATFYLVYATRLGCYLIALGGNREAARLSGIKIRYYEIWVYAFSGLLAAVAGILLTSRLNATHPTMGVMMEFDAIAAVIVGGTSFMRGNGGILSSIFGVAMIAILRNGMNLSGIDAFMQLPIIGLTILFAMAISTKLQNKRVIT